MADTPPKDPATGRFAPRAKDDQPISTVLAQEETKRVEQKAQADARSKEEQPKKPAPKDGLEDVGEQVLDEFVGVDRKKEKADRDAAKDKEKADKKRAAEDRAAARPKPTPPKAEPAAAPLDAASIAAAAAEGVARALKPKEEKTEKKEEVTLTGPEARHVEVLDRLEKLWPDEYKGASKRYKDAQVKIDAYRTQWEKDNPSEAFDEEAEEHRDYYEKNDLFEFWDQRDYARAAGSLEAERVRSKEDETKNKDLNAKLTDLERKEKLREEKPKIAADQVLAARSFWNSLGDDFADVMSEDGQVNRDRLTELMDADPVAMQDRIDAATRLNSETEAIYALMNGLATFDAKNSTHSMIGSLGEAMEEEILSKPAQEQLDNKGRKFMPGAKYYALPKEDREKYWTLSAADLAYHRGKVVAHQIEQKLKAETERLARRAAALGYSKANGSQNRDSHEPAENEEQPDERGSKPRSPSTGSESRLASRRIGAKNAEQRAGGAFFEGNF